MDPTALNLNLIIPFKDNKGIRRNLFQKEIAEFEKSLLMRVEELRSDLADIGSSDFELTIASRSDGQSKQFYWRFKTKNRDRKYSRLREDNIRSYINEIPHLRQDAIYAIEEELIYINGNLKIIRSFFSVMENVETEITKNNMRIIGK